MNKVFLFLVVWNSVIFCLISTVNSDDFRHDFLQDHFFREDEDYIEDATQRNDNVVQTPGNLDHHSQVDFAHEDCEHGVYENYSEHNTYFPFEHIENGIIRFVVRFRGKSDAHIFFSSESRNTGNVSFYSIVIGASYNRRTDFRLHYPHEREKEVAAISTPNILSSNHYRGFIVEYNKVTGYLSLFPELSTFPILRWRDPRPLDIKYFSFCAYDNVVLNVAYNCVGTDARSVISLEEVIASALQGGANTADSIRSKLLENYDVKMPPPKVDGQPIKVNVGFTLNYFTLDVQDYVFIANAWIRMSWVDSRLAYNTTSLTDWILRFGPDEIWKPDLTLYNNAYPTEIDHYADTHMMVYANGSVLWVPPARLAAHCSLNMILWPNDKHTCQLKFGSWTHHGQEIDLVFTPHGNDTTESGEYLMEHFNYVDNSEWKLLRTSVVRNAMFYPCCPEPWIDLTFSITFQRNSPSYMVIFVIPIILIPIVNMLSMMLPPTSGTKLTIGLVQFLIICIFLLYIDAKVPALGDHIPLLVFLYICNLVLVTISLIISVIVLNLAKTRKASTLPYCCRFLCNPQYVKFMGLGYLLPFIPNSSPLKEMKSPKRRVPQGQWDEELNGIEFGGEQSNSDDSANLVDIETMPPMPNAEWILLASMIDRIALIVFVFTNFVLLLACLL